MLLEGLLVTWSVCTHAFSGILGQGRRNQESLPSLGKPEGGVDEALGASLKGKERGLTQRCLSALGTEAKTLVDHPQSGRSAMNAYSNPRGCSLFVGVGH